MAHAVLRVLERSRNVRRAPGLGPRRRGARRKHICRRCCQRVLTSAYSSLPSLQGNPTGNGADRTKSADGRERRDVRARGQAPHGVGQPAGAVARGRRIENWTLAQRSAGVCDHNAHVMQWRPRCQQSRGAHAGAESNHSFNQNVAERCRPCSTDGRVWRAARSKHNY